MSTSLVAANPTGYPTNYPFTLRLEPNTANEELAEVTSGLGTLGTPWLITRGVDGTTAKSHIFDSVVTHGASARDLQEPQNHIAQTSPHGPPFMYTKTYFQTGGSFNFPAAFGAWPGPTLAIIKHSAASNFWVSLEISCYSSTAGVAINFGVYVDGVLNTLRAFFFNQAGVHMPIKVSGTICAGFAPATYNLTVAVSGASGVADLWDGVTITAQEYQS